MRTVSNEELADILKKHAMWLNGENGGIKADLCRTNLYGANLYGADLRGAYLSRADLSMANLYGADLRGADLRWTDLSMANLYGADLRGADLCEADLRGADLCEADLRGANLRGAYLRGANLRGAYLRGADLRWTDLRWAKNINVPLACPEKGSFTAFKKASGYIVELEIPSDALRSSSTTRKCRCSKAKVVSITNLDGTPSDVKSVASKYNNNFVYKLGETAEVSDFDTNRWNECAPGIHFFITRQEAVEYSF